MSLTESQGSLHNGNSESSAQERAVSKRFGLFRYAAIGMGNVAAIGLVVGVKLGIQSCPRKNTPNYL